MEYLNHPLVRGAISGFLAAAVVDFSAFRKFKTVDEFAAYNWQVAAFRWAQGAVIGAFTSVTFD